MATQTIAFCPNCKWRSSITPGRVFAAGAPCPTCGRGVSDIQYDPTYTATIAGQPYSAMAAAVAQLVGAGVSTVGPAVTIPIPAHPVQPIVIPTPLPTSVS